MRLKSLVASFVPNLNGHGAFQKNKASGARIGTPRPPYKGCHHVSTIPSTIAFCQLSRMPRVRYANPTYTFLQVQFDNRTHSLKSLTRSRDFLDSTDEERQESQ